MEATFESRPTTATLAPAPSSARRWIGRVLSGLAVLFLTFDATMKIIRNPFVVEASTKIGFPDASIQPIGLVLLACVVVYVIPRTAILGAVLLTGYLGGAIATHVRLGDPFFSHTIFPAYFAVLLWGGLYLRDRRVAAIVPWARATPDA
jgi:hypothetical protein